MKKVRHIVNVLVFIVVATVSFAQSESELQEDAGKLFENEQYVDATPLYLQLLSLNPTSADYNFRYGACLLSNSYKKQDAIRYLNFAVKDGAIDPRAFYFHGKALHLNYQFEDAKSSYKKYLSKRGKKDKRYSVEREIEMCDNGKKLLAQFTDIIVSEKQEIDNQKFFRLYKNMQTIGGDILVSAEFQSKLDKKKGHIPIVHFPPQAKAIYYSSYGDDESTGKDIYIRRRLPNGGWGNPQILPGVVNTNEDEDFPYMHPSGDFLYFSSKGHNSMGGYDVFFSRYNPNINAFGKPENVDFAISSPDDDLFYVVDSLHKNAYFASSRQSQNGKLHVYNVRVARVPIQEIIVMGDFLSEINPENKSMFVNVTSNTNGAEVGKIKSNAKGKYSFVFPKGGKYNYEVTVDGSEDIYKFMVELPYLDEFRPLKQKAIHAMVDGQEVVRIVNLFDEKVEGAEALIADVIRKRATLEVNVDQFDLKELDAQEERNKVLAEMGFNDMSLLEVSGQLEELAITENLKRETVDLIEANLSNEIVDKAERINELQVEINELLEQAKGIQEPGEKHKVLLEAQKLEAEKNQLALEIQRLNELKTEALATVGGDANEAGRMEVLENQFNTLLDAQKEDEALALLSENTDVINKTRNQSPNQIVNDLVAESLKLNDEVDELKNQEKELEKSKHTAESELILIKNEYANAKKKDFERLRNEIAEKEAEIELIKEYNKEVKEKITDKNIELGVVDNSIASMQKAMLNEDVAAIDQNKIAESVSEAESVINAPGAVESELEAFVTDNPEFDPNYVADENVTTNDLSEQAEIFKEDYEERKAEIVAQRDLTELERTQMLKVLSEEVYSEALEQKTKIETAIATSGATAELEVEKKALDDLINELTSDITSYESTIAEIESPITAITAEDLVNDLAPFYQSDVISISESDNSELDKSIELKELEEGLVEELQSELVKTEKEINKNPEDKALQSKQTAIEELIAQKESEISELNQTINALNQTTSVVTEESVMNEVLPSYAESLSKIENDETLSEEGKLEARVQLEESLLDELNSRYKQVEKSLKKDENNSSLLAEKGVIEQLLVQKENEIATLNQSIASLNESTTEVTIESVMNEVLPDYAESLSEIEGNELLSGQEKIEQKLKLEESSLDKLNTRAKAIEKSLKKDSDNPTLLSEKGLVEELVTQKENEIASLKEQLNSVPTITESYTEETILAEVSPNYEESKSNIQNDSSLSESEKLDRIQEIENDLASEVNEQIEAVQDELRSNPTDESLVNKKDVLEQLKIKTEQNITDNALALEELKEQNNNPADIVNVDRKAIEEALKSELISSYQEDRSALVENGSQDFNTNKELLSLDVEQLENLESKLKQVEEAIAKNPEDQSLIATKEVLETIIKEQESAINETKEALMASVTALEVIQYQKEVDNDYPFDIAAINGSDSPTKAREAVDREQELQAKLQEKIEENKVKMSRSYSVTFDVENMILERAVNESVEREKEAESMIPVDAQEDIAEQRLDFITSVREEALGEGDQTLEQSFETKDELVAQEQMLVFYEAQIDQQIENKKEELKSTDNKELVNSQIDWLEEEKEKVAVKRRSISVSIGELEQVVIADNTTVSESNNNDEQLRSLENEAAKIEAQLTEGNLSKSEEKALSKELGEAQVAIAERENELVSEQIENAQADNAAVEEEIESIDSPSTQVEKAIQANEAQQTVINDMIEEAENASSEAERNYLLNKVADEQQAQNAALTELLIEEKIRKIEEEQEVSLVSKESLEQKRRRFTVQIGDLSTEIIKVEQEIESAKKKEIPVLETKKSALIAEKELVEAQLRLVEEKLLEESTTVNVISPEALSTEITFNEERQLAANESYEPYYEVASEALIIEKQIGKLEEEINNEQQEINQLLSSNSVDQTIIDEKVNAIKTKQAEVNKLNIELVQKNYEAKQALPDNPEEAMKMQNLIMRGVKPLKAAAIATAIIQMPSNGLAINEEATSPYSEANPIPVGVEAPSGLVYRVQIGAFARPIPQDLFKEFNPVSGEKIGSTNITRYMAGFFNNSNDVVDARTQIRSLGYSDAFVVAYCDGERIGFGEARRREAAGTCVPKGTNELMLEVATKTAEKLGIPLTNEVQEVPELTYNQAPGAVDADPIELKQGLFFTVQIGVFNRPVSSEEIYNLPDVLTIRLPNGQMRYASGMFNSAEEALPRQDEARRAGIVGPFITAYYKGERISIGNARRILYNEGEDVLQTNIEAKEALEVIETPTNVIRTDSVSTAVPVESISEVTDEYIQIVTKKKFNDFPRDVLNRYNAEGNFYFDAKDSLVKSIIYSDVDDLPRLYNFRKDIDTLYIPREELEMNDTKIVSIKLDSVVPGDFMDWLLRFNYRREFVQTSEGRELRIFGIEPNDVEKVQNDVRIFALEAVIVEETVYELELEENK